MAINQNDGHGGRQKPGTSPKRKLASSFAPRRAHALNHEIGRKMRAMYDDLMQQPLPDRFVELLKQIDQGRENKPQ